MCMCLFTYEEDKLSTELIFVLIVKCKKEAGQDEQLQCVRLRGICWQKWNITFITMSSLVYDHPKLRLVVFSGVASP